MVNLVKGETILILFFPDGIFFHSKDHFVSILRELHRRRVFHCVFDFAFFESSGEHGEATSASEVLIVFILGIFSEISMTPI